MSDRLHSTGRPRDVKAPKGSFMEAATLSPQPTAGRPPPDREVTGLEGRLAGSAAGRHHRAVSTAEFVGDTLAVLQAALAERYRLEHLLGRGGMGIVYLAHDLKHDRAVAIKVVLPEVAALLGPERFLREISVAAQLRHPHIVPLHDSGEAGGLLYYVMPYVTGETLRERLDREGRLPVDEALGIARQVASALAHAHRHGVIHRDIKPTNILLSEGFALVADFGLARALSGARGDPEISAIGLAVGTPGYMSPEQSAGSPDVDGRSDLYSLGCVLQEMLLGTLPPEAGRPRRSDSPARGSVARPALPAGVERALARCLEGDPADRYATAEELLAGLGAPVEPLPKHRAVRVLLTVLVLGLAGWALARVAGLTGARGADATLDTSRYAVLPFERLPGAPAFRADLPLRTALERWSGISVVSGVQVSEALKGAGSPTLDRGSASLVAQRVGAGRIVRGQVVPFGDSVQVEAVVYDTRDRSALLGKSVRLPRDLGGSDSVVSRLVDSLLFRGAIPVEHFEAPPGTFSVPAMWEFIRGRDAYTRWDLAAADSGFSRALTLDSTFARAALWLAQVRAWQGLPPVEWRSPAGQAVAGASRLGSRDTALAGVLMAMSRGEYGAACPRWLALTRQWPNEFPVWYGAATCLGRDGGVERDPRSPTGWTFRSSYHQAQRAWRQAFSLLPRIYRDFRAGDFHSTRWLLWTSANRARSGFAVRPDTGFFVSYPTWEGDTLAFVPRPSSDFTMVRATRTRATREAVTRQRLAFYDLATEWASADPRSLEAREAVGLALWALGNRAAIDSIQATRAHARAPGDRLRLGVSEALMRTLAGAPDSTDVATVKAIADSMLSLDPSSPDVDPWDLATLAALTGRANLSARLIRRASPRTVGRLPPALSGDALALLAFAALGGPADSLRVLEGRVVEGIAIGMDAASQSRARSEWLGRPLALVALDVPLSSFSQLAGTGDYLIDAEAALAAGDTATVVRLLRRAETSRAGMVASELMFEALLPEARLLTTLGDRRAAIARLDPTLTDLRHVSLSLVSDPVGAGLLVRSMALRRDLAEAAGDTVNARRWAAAVGTLWSDADSFLLPIVRRMSRPAHDGNH
jgi:protein kinase-like protein